MNRLTQWPRIEVDVNIKLTIAEVQALEALAGYGTDGFLEVFYKQMGKHYLEPHEAGLRSLFDTIRGELPPSSGAISPRSRPSPWQTRSFAVVKNTMR